jgi:hypothetical protein
MTDTKPKYFTNPLRKVEKPYTPYVPHYQMNGIQPAKVGGMPVDTKGVPTPNRVNIVAAMPGPQRSTPLIVPRNVPYANLTQSNFGPPPGFISLPNNGNNIEQAWHGDVLEEGDVQLSDADEVIDNNEFVNVEALQMPSKFDDQLVDDLPSENESEEMIISIGEFVLLVDGNVMIVGSQEKVQEAVQAILFGEFPGVGQKSMDDLIVLRRVEVKAGVFIGS